MPRIRTITDTLASDGVGHEMSAHVGDELAFSVTGHFVGLVILEQWCVGGPRRRLQLDAAAAGHFTVAPMDVDWSKAIHFRWRMDGHRRGDAVATLTSDPAMVEAFKA